MRLGLGGGRRRGRVRAHIVPFAAPISETKHMLLIQGFNMMEVVGLVGRIGIEFAVSAGVSQGLGEGEG